MRQIELNFPYDWDYPVGFFAWINDNEHVWRRFEDKALQMAKIRKRYSARTVVEILRWYSDLEDSDTMFHLNNNIAPGLARLWMRKHGRLHPKFFDIRSSA